MRAADPIWGTEATVDDWDYGGFHVRDSYAVGGVSYRIHASAAREIGSLEPKAKAKLTTWILSQVENGTATPVVNTETLALIETRRRRSISQRKISFLRYLRSIDYQPGDEIDLDDFACAGTISAWTESATREERHGLLQLLRQDGILQTRDTVEWQLTSLGHERLDDLTSKGAETKQAFVAMWFGADVQEAYLQAIKPAIEDAGYAALRIDQKDHANKIDDEIVAEIRRSKFVVADFTCPVTIVDGQQIASPRGGVYFEAGFAQGLGIDVIWSIRRNCLDHLHFDTRQYAHIDWENHDDLYDRLFNKIVAVIGHVKDAPGKWTSRSKPK